MNNIVTVFEHDSIYINKGYPKLTLEEFKALQLFHKEKNFPYYDLVNKGVRFCEYVGVLQVGKLTIEVLPKTDRNNDTKYWRSLLIDMLKSSGIFDTKAPTSAQLKLKSNFVLNHYFEMFISEVEQLLHYGLIKRYRKTEQNSFSLKGKLLFSKHLSSNFVHHERFYVQHAIYDYEHLFNQVLLKTLCLLRHINFKHKLSGRLATLILNFPELKDIKVSESTFENILYDRKNQGYQKAIEIAKLLLLNYHPDINGGRNHVLALMFDMNQLWEKFVLKALQRNNDGKFNIYGQTSKKFWKTKGGKIKNMKPDIVIESREQQFYILDTKWKNIGESYPSDDDLRQMFTYHKYHKHAHVFLVYPGERYKILRGAFMNELVNHEESKNQCSIIKVMISRGNAIGQKELAEKIFEFIEI